MNKSEMIEVVANRSGITHNEAKKAVNAMLCAITRGIKRGPVHIDGFGTFRTRHRKARKGCNPRTGEPIDIQASTYPIFVAGKQIKDKINS